MNDNYSPINNYLEWEVLNSDIKLSQIVEHGLLPEIMQGGVIKRNDEYGIETVVYGEGRFNGLKLKRSLRPGERYEGFDVYGLDEGGNEIVITGVVDLGYHSVGNKVAIPLLINKVTRKLFNEEVKPDGWVSIWCLNGEIPFHSLRFTEREIDGARTRVRKNQELDLNITKYPIVSSYSSSDYFFVKTKNVKYCVSKVPKQVGPEWGENIGIEFPAGQEAFENENIRKLVLEIISFLIGGRLINIGHTIFYKNGIPCLQVAIQPWGSGIKKECDKPPQPPIKFGFYPRIDDVEKLFSIFTDNYLKSEKSLNLSSALWRYWVSLSVPVNIGFASIIIGIETIINSWYRIQKDTRINYYLDPAEWESIISELKNRINVNLEKNQYRDRILRKLSNVIKFSENEKVHLFFSYLGLRIGAVEEAVLKLRSKLIHGGVTKPEQGPRLVLYLRAGQTLFHRIVLNLLGYKGQYVDYSSYGFPLRKIEEPLGGPEDDGKMPEL